MNLPADRTAYPNIVTKQQGNSSPLKIYFRTITHLKLIKHLISQIVLNSLDAGYDLYQYLRYTNTVGYSPRDRQKLESMLYFYYHKIEKSLTLPVVKPLFGLGYIETVLDLEEKWAVLNFDLNAVVFRGACAALLSYQKHVNQELSQARPEIARRLDNILATYGQPDVDSSLGGTITISRKDMVEITHNSDFENFICQRHSVRNFTELHIPDSEIIHAVKLAQRTPSVCNRQCWRVHIFTTPEDKAKALQHQNGNEGFGHLADRVLIITADLRCFQGNGERNQAFVDAGMFAMTLILALKSRGIESCCLNLCLSTFASRALHRDCNIPDWEIPVMMVVIGYPPERLQVAVSVRKPTESMLSFHN